MLNACELSYFSPAFAWMAGLLVGPRALGDALKLGSSDLRFTLSRNDVPDEVQAHFFENGVTNVNKFSSFSAVKKI